MSARLSHFVRHYQAEQYNKNRHGRDIPDNGCWCCAVILFTCHCSLLKPPTKSKMKFPDVPPKHFFVFHIAFSAQIRIPICHSLSAISSGCSTAFLLLCLPQ